MILKLNESGNKQETLAKIESSRKEAKTEIRKVKVDIQTEMKQVGKERTRQTQGGKQKRIKNTGKIDKPPYRKGFSRRKR